MPQLDVSSYFSQVVWLVFCFFFMHIYLVKISLPRIYKILYIRKFLLLKHSRSIDLLDREIFFLNKGLSRFSLLIFNNLSLMPVRFLSVRNLCLTEDLIESRTFMDKSNLFLLEDECLLSSINSGLLCDNTVYLDTKFKENFGKKLLNK